MKRITAIIVLAILSSAAAWAHSGGTDSQGCHVNHKTGGWHCH